MIFKNYVIRNSNFSLTIDNIDFSRTGIYLIKGPNGTGKTTLLKKILFGDTLGRFNTTEQEMAYKHNRAALISYVPQEIPVPDVIVSEYIRKGNNFISEKDINNYLKAFGLEKLDYKSKISKLSGGEMTKLSILTAMLKNTPYIVLDEPTNHLDDVSTKQLMTLLDEYSRNRTVILVSHDPRICVENIHQVLFNKNGTVSSVEYSSPINIAKSISLFKMNRIHICIQLLLKNIIYYQFLFFVYFFCLF